MYTHPARADLFPSGATESKLRSLVSRSQQAVATVLEAIYEEDFLGGADAR
jgi:hypothetical protein